MVIPVDNKINIDVIVVGGGLGGLNAARTAAEKGARVVLIDKARVGTSGPTAFAAGDILCWFPEEEALDDWVNAYINAGEGINYEERIRNFLEGQYRLVKELHKSGFPFAMDSAGSFIRRSGRGPMTKCVLAPMLQFQEKNRKRCLDLGVSFLERVGIEQIVMSDGCPAGVVGFNVLTGETVKVSAPSIVLASGGCSYRGPFFGQDVVAGEGLRLALQAKALLAYMEYGNHYNVSLAAFDSYGQSKFMAHGGRYVNEQGEAFLERNGSSPLGNKINGNAAVKAMAKEVQAGHGPIYMDLTQFKDWNLVANLMPNLMSALQKSQINLSNHRQLVIPAFTGTSNASAAGIFIDNNACSTVPGLFAAGDCAAKGLIVGACVGITGISLAWANYTGSLAGQNAATYALEGNSTTAKEELWQIAERNMLQPLQRKSGARELLNELTGLVCRLDVSLIRSENRLQEALTKVRQITAMLESEIGADSSHDLMLWHEARSSAQVAEASLISALARKETRGAHYREDYSTKEPGMEAPLGVIGDEKHLAVQWIKKGVD